MSDWIDAEAHVERAHDLYEAGRWAEAAAALREAIALNPYQPDWLFNLGVALEADGRYEEAASAFGESYQLRSGDFNAAMAAGVNLVRAGKVRPALAWFDKAEAAEPGEVYPAIARIEAHAQLGEHDEAELAFYMLQQRKPECAEAYSAIAASLLSRGLHDRAVWCLREAARLEPDLPGVQAKLAEAYWQTGRHERARQLFLIELREDPGDVGVLMNLGRLLVEMRRLDEAREKFGRVLELEPDHAEAHAELGFLHEKRGEPARAVVHLDVARRLEPDNGEVTRRLARLLLASPKAEDRQRTVELLEAEVERLHRVAEREGQEELSTDGAALAELGELLIDAGAQTQAIRVLSRATRMRPHDARLWHWLGLAHFHASDRASGIDATREAVRLDPRFVPAMHNIALALLREGQWSRARYWLKQGLSVEPEDASLRRLDVQLKLHRLGWSLRWVASVWLLRRRPALKA